MQIKNPRTDTEYLFRDDMRDKHEPSEILVFLLATLANCEIYFSGIYRGSTLIACDKISTHATFFMMITESPGLIRATPRWSSDEFLPKLFHQASLSLGHFLSYSSLQRFTYSIRF